MEHKDYSEDEFSPPELSKFLIENNLGVTFKVLSNGLINYRSRVRLLKEKSDLLKKVLTSPLPSQDVYSEMAKIHVQQLDYLSSIFMFLEDFLAYSFNLSGSLSKLQEFPSQIASENFNVLNKEIENLRSKVKSDISDYLLFPNIELLGLTQEKKNLLKNVLDRILVKFDQSMQRILEFYDNYYRVYIKYKHVLTAVIGLHEINDISDDPSKKVVSSHIYIRDRYKEQFKTHIIACNVETVTYYEDIVNFIKCVFELLILSYMQYLMNYGKRSIIPTNNYIKDEEKELWSSILKTNKGTVLYPNFQIYFNIYGELAKALRDILPKRFIYTKKSDIFLH